MGRWGGLPQAYRIWCARVCTTPEGLSWRKFVGRYTDEEFEAHLNLKTYVFDFGEAIKWLNGPGSLLLVEPDE
jgi:hypothetical protein